MHSLCPFFIMCSRVLCFQRSFPHVSNSQHVYIHLCAQFLSGVRCICFLFTTIGFDFFDAFSPSTLMLDPFSLQLLHHSLPLFHFSHSFVANDQIFLLSVPRFTQTRNVILFALKLSCRLDRQELFRQPHAPPLR